MIELILAAALPWILIALLWWYFYGLHQDYWDDLTRERLCATRAELFDAAVRGDLNFEDAAYRRMRATLNGAIRYTHALRIWSFVLSRWSVGTAEVRALSQEYERDFKKELLQLSFPGRRAVLRARANMHLHVIVHLYHTSLVLWLLFVPAVNALRLLHQLQRVRRWALRGQKRKEPWPTFDATSYRISQEPNAHAR